VRNDLDDIKMTSVVEWVKRGVTVQAGVDFGGFLVPELLAGTQASMPRLV